MLLLGSYLTRFPSSPLTILAAAVFKRRAIIFFFFFSLFFFRFFGKKFSSKTENLSYFRLSSLFLTRRYFNLGMKERERERERGAALFSSNGASKGTKGDR